MQKKARININPDGSPVTVQKHDNLETLKKQRTEARTEIERIMQFVKTNLITAPAGGFVLSKLTYLKDKILREDM